MADNSATKGVGTLKVYDDDVMTNMTDVFYPPLKTTSILYMHEFEYRPTSIVSKGPFLFRIPTENSDLYFDPGSVRLEGKITITVKRPTETTFSVLTDNETISVVENYPQSLFRSTTVNFNGYIVSYTATPMNAMKSEIETILTYSRDAAATHLMASRFLIDAPNKHTNAAITQADTPMFERAKWIAKSKPVDFCIPLHLDVFNVDRYYPPQVDISITLDRNSDEFSIITPDADLNTYKITIDDLVLRINRVALDPLIAEEHRKRLAKGERMVFPVVRNIIRTYPMLQNKSEVRVDNLFTAPLPYAVIVCMVDSDAYDGDKTKNPYHFKHNDIREFYTVKGHRQYPSAPLTFDFTADKMEFMRAYRFFFDNLAIHNDNTGNMITPDLYADGKFMLPLDFNPDKCNGYHYHPSDDGNLSIVFKFRKPLPRNVTAIFHASYKDHLEIDGKNRVFLSSEQIII